MPVRQFERARRPLDAAVGDRRGAARGLLDRLEVGANEAAHAGAIARILLGLGEHDSAFTWLERAAALRDPMFSSESLASPLFDPLRGDPRFVAVLRELNLAVPELLRRK